jgi:hypothetical protein
MAQQELHSQRAHALIVAFLSPLSVDVCATGRGLGVGKDPPGHNERRSKAWFQRLRPTDHRPQATGHRLRATGYMPKVSTSLRGGGP